MLPFHVSKYYTANPFDDISHVKEQPCVLWLYSLTLVLLEQQGKFNRLYHRLNRHYLSLSVQLLEIDSIFFLSFLFLHSIFNFTRWIYQMFYFRFLKLWVNVVLMFFIICFLRILHSKWYSKCIQRLHNFCNLSCNERISIKLE